jgi:hypothetical protein
MRTVAPERILGPAAQERAPEVGSPEEPGKGQGRCTVRAYLLAFGLTALIIGLPILFAGSVGIGCTVTDHGTSTVYSNCGGAQSLELIGEILIVLAVIFFVGSFVPNSDNRYK